MLDDPQTAEETKQKIRQWEVEVDFGGGEGNQIVVWKEGKPAGKKRVEAEELLARLNDEEKEVIQEAVVADRYDERFQTREKFGYALRFSGVREPVAEMVVGEAEGVLQKEYTDPKIQRNKRYVDGALADVERERAEVTKKIQNAEKAWETLRKYHRAQNEIAQLDKDELNAEDALPQLQNKLQSEKNNLDALPQTMGVWGKKRVKKEYQAEETRLAGSIKDIEEQIAQATECINTAPRQRAALEKQQAEYMKEIEQLLPAGAVQDGKLVWGVPKVEQYPNEIRRKLNNCNDKERELKAAWSIWQEGKFLELSIPEVEFIVSYQTEQRMWREGAQTPLQYLEKIIAGHVRQAIGVGQPWGVVSVSLVDNQLHVWREGMQDVYKTGGYQTLQAPELFKEFFDLKSKNLTRLLEVNIKKQLGGSPDFQVRFVFNE